MATLAEARAVLPGSGCTGTVAAPPLEREALVTVRPRGRINAFYETSLRPFVAPVAQVPRLFVLAPTIDGRLPPGQRGLSPRRR